MEGEMEGEPAPHQHQHRRQRGFGVYRCRRQPEPGPDALPPTLTQLSSGGSAELPAAGISCGASALWAGAFHVRVGAMSEGYSIGDVVGDWQL